jgi:opacity protein-like surface antigen
MIKTVLLGVALTTSVLAQTEYSPYLSADVGVGYMNDSTLAVNGLNVGEYKYDAGIVYQGAVGVKVDQRMGRLPFRAEVAGVYQSSDISGGSLLGVPQAVSGEVTLGSVLLNGYIDYPMGHGLAPYVMAGFGYTYAELDNGTSTMHDNLFCGQIGGGLGYAIVEHLIIDLRYTFFMSQDAYFEDMRTELSSNQFALGLRYAF